jgi:hypothetical protein
MKNLLTLLIILLGTSAVNAQENSVFVDSILNLVVNNQLTIFNKDFREIKSSEIKIIYTDTVINCQWTRPKYIDNIFQEGFDGVLVRHPAIFYTSPNQANNNYLEFKKTIHDDDGNYIKDSTFFLIDKREIKKKIAYKPPDHFSKLKNTVWQNKAITLKGEKIELDSCHILFRLALHKDLTFTQYYGQYEKSCSTEDMAEKVNVGVESAAYFEYFYKLQGHYIEMPTGIWQVEDNTLKLEIKKDQRIISFRLLKLTKDEMQLELPEYEYIITLEKATR